MTFRLPDPERQLAGVRLVQDIRIPGDRLGFHRGGDGWELVIDRPPVNRMEYLLELRHAGGGTETVLDTENPRQVAGAFGPKSVLEFPGYTPPGWLSIAAEPGNVTDVDVPVKALDARSLSGSGLLRVHSTTSACRCCTRTAVTRTRSTRCSCSPAVSSCRASTPVSSGSTTTAGSSRSSLACTTAGCRTGP